MNLKMYINILWGNKWVVIITLLVTVAVTTAFTFLTAPIFTASTTLRIASASTGSVSYSDYIYADRLMNTYTKIATSRPVLEELAAQLNLQKAPQVKVTSIASTELIKISVESTNPVVARDAANKLAEILIAQSREYYSGGGRSQQEILGEQLTQAQFELTGLKEQYNTLLAQNPRNEEELSVMSEAIQTKEKTYSTLLDLYEQARLREVLRENIISVVEPAVIPAAASKPNKVMNISLGFILGLVGGVGLVFLLENLDSRLYTTEQIEIATGMVPIGKIPGFNNKGLSSTHNSNFKVKYTLFKESFRRLQTIIQTQYCADSNGKPVKTLLFTSALPGEGKSTIISNLALAFARTGKKILVVDCDLRIPTQHKTTGLPNKSGLSNVLNSQCKPEDVIQKTRYGEMYLLPSGPIPLNPAELIGSPQMKATIDQISEKFDLVLLDAPALLPVADATLVANLADGVILVARRAFSKEASVREACKYLSEINAPLLGVVVNEAEQNGTYYYYSS